MGVVHKRREKLIFSTVVIIIIFGDFVSYVDSSHCGPHGFRCISKTSYMRCSKDNLEEEDVEFQHSCPENTECNEQYASICEGYGDEDDDVMSIVERKSRKIKGKRGQNDEINDYIQSALLSPEENSYLSSKNNTNTKDKLSSAEKLTASKTQEGFTCIREGKFPNQDNPQQYWFCGSRFGKSALRPELKVCPKGFQFDPIRSECMDKGSGVAVAGSKKRFALNCSEHDGVGDDNKQGQYDYVVVVNLQKNDNHASVSAKDEETHNKHSHHNPTATNCDHHTKTTCKHGHTPTSADFELISSNDDSEDNSLEVNTHSELDDEEPPLAMKCIENEESHQPQHEENQEPEVEIGHHEHGSLETCSHGAESHEHGSHEAESHEAGSHEHGSHGHESHEHGSYEEGSHEAEPHEAGSHEHGCHEHESHEDGSHEHGPHEEGSHEHGFHEHESHEDGSHEHGFHEHESHEDGSHEHGSHEEGSHEHGFHEHESHEDGSREHGSHEEGSHEHGFHEHESDENGSHEHGSHEHGCHEHESHEDGSHEHGPHEEGSHEHGFHEHESHEDGSHEHGSHEEGSHEHGFHEHESHEDGSHEHGPHEEGSHEHGFHEHESHEDGSHEHGPHEEGSHEHVSHEHESHEYTSHEHESHENGSPEHGPHEHGSHEEGSHEHGSYETESDETGHHEKEELFPFCCKKSGVFPDPTNCSRFYICHPKRLENGFEEIKVCCPENTAFDSQKHKCTSEVFPHCQKQQKSEVFVVINLKKRRRKRKVLTRNALAPVARPGHNPAALPISNASVAKDANISPPKLSYVDPPVNLLDDRVAFGYRPSMDIGPLMIKPASPAPGKQPPQQLSKFRCLKEGRFPDPSNQRGYYMCFPESKGRYMTFRMQCPGEAKFSPSDLACTKL